MFERYRQFLRGLQPMGVTGRVSAVHGLKVGISDFPAPMGAGCRICSPHRGVDARVIGFAGKQTLAMPIGAMTGIARGDRVVLTSAQQTVDVSTRMLGRVVDGLGRPIDGRGPIAAQQRATVWREPIEPMDRRPIDKVMATGVRAIDAMTTVGMGQRMGIFAASGVGKSLLSGAIARNADVDVAVIALIGERGREVGDFLERQLGEGLARTVVVAATGDEPPLLRVQAAAVATAIAEFFRDQGNNVLLLVDSLTRLAAAQRQIGLVAGEPPTTKGYTPSVFSLLPELLERCGRTARGSVTGFYTVLVEGDDLSDPISDAVRAVTDGHLVLSAELARRGHYPAIDVLASVSRVMPDVTDSEHRRAAVEVRRLLGIHREIEDLVTLGAYRRGTSCQTDLALDMMPHMSRLLTQDIGERAEFHETRGELLGLLERASADSPASRQGSPT